ncbi:MAG: hypothetical protein IJ131_06480, partial [Eggerthellaceae bacterium]|nr:hypothetical protein [Eggerthellaceae bacterium]
MNRIFRKKRVRALCAQAVAVLCLACLCVPWNAAPALAAGSFRAEPVTAADLYNGGYYIKLLKASNGVYGMSATGGRIVELDALPEEARDYSTGGKDWRGLRGRGENDRYCHIYPHLVNNRDSEGWHYIGGNGDAFAFVSDGDSKDNGAVGGRFSVTWKKAGVLRSTKGKLGAENELPEGGIYVDIRVDSTLVNTVDTSSWLFTSPKAVVQFTNRFDWGFFQLGVTRMDQTFTFIDSETGSEVPINGPLSVLESSLDQGEGFMIQGASASRVSSTAPATNTHAGNVPAGILE